MNTFIKVDRSRIVTRQACAKRRYLEYDYKGTGMSPVKTGDALAFGIALHACLEQVLKFHKEQPGVKFGPAQWEALRMSDVLAYATATKAQCLLDGMDEDHATHKANEQAFLLEMLVYGWTQQRLPRLLEEYTIDALEQEFEVKLASDVKLMVRIDAVLRHKVSNLLFILDYKSLSTLSDDWMVKCEHSAQSSLYIYALEQAMNEYVGGIMYEGFVKGTARTETNGLYPWDGIKVQTSPLVYVYTNELASEVKHEYTKAKGWRKTPAWHINDAADHYATLRGCYAGDLPQFCVVPPVRPPQDALDRTVNQTIVAEREYYAKLAQVNAAYNLGREYRAEELSDILFELSYGTCYKYGRSYACPFTMVCHGGVRADDPEQFKPRVPHHAGEFDDAE